MRISSPALLPFVYWVNHIPENRTSLTKRKKSFTVGTRSKEEKN